MYQHHAALEDAIIFPAWKATLNEEQPDEIGDKFEEIEQQQFGKDGCEDLEVNLRIFVSPAEKLIQ